MNIFRLNRHYAGRSIMRSVLVGLLLSLSLGVSVSSFADEDSKKEKHSDKKTHVKKEHAKKGKHSKKEDIMLEISYLAKKLLDMSGEDMVTVTSPSVVKPFIGVCSSIQSNGVKLTCITPESQADKNGLKTGDVITYINGISMNEGDNEKRMHAYWDVVKTMKVGDVLKLGLIRAGKELDIDVTVGSLSHPAYTLTVGG